jgi:hypothetical protein
MKVMSDAEVIFMLESEAKKKWCPMTRFHSVGACYSYDNKPCTPENKFGEASKDSPLCIGSACMLWIEKWPPPQPRGYCGLTRGDIHG